MWDCGTNWNYAEILLSYEYIVYTLYISDLYDFFVVKSPYFSRLSIRRWVKWTKISWAV
jgi:hypothetical protein